MNKTFKILLLALLAVVVVQSVAVVVIYRRNAELAKKTNHDISGGQSANRNTVAPNVLEKIDQLDAANVSADIQRFRQDHPEIKNTVQPEALSDQGIVREFDRVMMTADVRALSEICKRVSADPFSRVTIKTITDNPQICGITRVERPSERDERGAGTPRRIAIYQYEMTDSKQKPFSGTCYLAVSWSKQSGSWALETAISTGSFFNIEKKR